MQGSNFNKQCASKIIGNKLIGRNPRFDREQHWAEIGEIGQIYLAQLNWDSQLGRTFSLTFQRNFPISFKPKVTMAKFVWEMQKKSGIMKSGVDAMHLFLSDNLLSP